MAYRSRATSLDAALVLADGTAFEGTGVGRCGIAVGELVFNTTLTGYQEILTDPSYARQIVTFTAPHVGNVGCNAEDFEASRARALGAVLRCRPSEPSNWRSTASLGDWLEEQGIFAVCGIDTRRITRLLRDRGAQKAAIAFCPGERPDIASLAAMAAGWEGMEGLDLVPDVTTDAVSDWAIGGWAPERGYMSGDAHGPHVVVLDYGVKANILRSLVERGCRVTFMPATSRLEEVLARQPDGVLLANGPGDPAATATYAAVEINALINAGLPVFGICLGHQMLGLAAGARTVKMAFGHHGANHPVQDLGTGRVLITSQNHGFAIDEDGLPPGVRVTHRSLFDGTIQGIELVDRPVFSVQFHPEASPGPHDAAYLFDRFLSNIGKD